MTIGRLNRRQLLKALSMCATGGAATLSTLLHERRGVAQTQDKKPYFLIVLPGAGGASIIDSALAIRHSESPNWETVNSFPDNEVLAIPDSPLRAVNMRRGNVGQIPIPFVSDQAAFVNRHKQDMMAVTVTGTSVNHRVAQKRSLTGNEAWNGRTLQEVVALEYGAGFPLPNVNMTGDGYILRGTDDSLPAYCFHEPVADATVWPVGLDGSKGIKDLPSRALIEKARAVREGALEAESPFGRTFARSKRLALWRSQRQQQQDLEAKDLITKLMFVPDIPQIPLSEYGLLESPDGRRVREVFPSFLQDPLEAQAALAFLLIKHRVSVTVSISPSFGVLVNTAQRELTNPPLAFDFSHNSHRGAQAIMWQRIYRIADGLIRLLQNEEFDAGTGESYWDRTLIYVATEFGRDKRRTNGADDFGTAHHLNNGYVVISPLANGNRVLGGVDPATGLTYGFDPETGAPDRNRNMMERDIYAGILHALKVDTSGSGLPDVRAMRKNA
jgi:hypothetical protein